MGTLSELGNVAEEVLVERPMRKTSVVRISADAPIASVDLVVVWWEEEVVPSPLLSSEWWLVSPPRPPSSSGCPSPMGS